MKAQLKLFSYLLLLSLCFNCLNAQERVSPENKKIERQLLKQIDTKRMTYKLYKELFKIHPDIKIFKNIIAAKKNDFSTLVDYAEKNYPELKTGPLNGLFKVRETEKLYSEWLKKGKASSKSAVDVSVDLEKADDEDISGFLKMDLEPELVAILERLKQSSKKHLATFRRKKTRS